jgi:hypothetical protein
MGFLRGRHLTELLIFYFQIYGELPFSVAKNRFQRIKPKYGA